MPKLGFAFVASPIPMRRKHSQPFQALTWTLALLQSRWLLEHIKLAQHAQELTLTRQAQPAVRHMLLT